MYQFSHEFMEDWQVFAANGYAVIGVEPARQLGPRLRVREGDLRRLGREVDTADVLAGVDHVVKLGVADPDRLGLGGHSYGGILTDQVIARDPRFKAAISSAGAANMFGMWGVDMYIREYELELGLPWRDRETYERVSYPFFHADRITHADAVPLRRARRQRALRRLDADVPGAALARGADAARDLPGRVPRPDRAELPRATACSGCSTGTGSTSACCRRARSAS